MTRQTMRRPKSTSARPKRQIVLFCFVLLLSAGLMYLDIALRFRP